MHLQLLGLPEPLELFSTTTRLGALVIDATTVRTPEGDAWLPDTYSALCTIFDTRRYVPAPAVASRAVLLACPSILASFWNSSRS